METANFWSTWLGRSPASSTEPLRKEFQPVAEPIAQPLDVEREQPAKVPQPTLTVPEEPVTVADPLTASVPAGAAPVRRRTQWASRPLDTLTRTLDRTTTT